MGKKILIADDEVHLRLLIEQTLEELEDEGVEILTSADGRTALALVMSAMPDLVLLDVMMPEMNGFEVCEQIRKSPGISSTYVILLTAKGQEYDRARGDQAGANAYMTKPFNPDELLATVRRAIGLGDA